MERKARIAAIVALVFGLLLGLTSCDSVLGLFAKPDLLVNSVEQTPFGSLDAVSITIWNDGLGGTGEDVEVLVVFSEDDFLTTSTDPHVWQGTIAAMKGGEKVDFDLSNAQMRDWMEAHSSSCDAGDYYIGVFVDPDNKIEEKDDSNNRKLSGSQGYTDAIAF